ncbi:Hpt domain-containing protein [Terriglobus saanensis]|uniref:Hpt domain protein n=1 Tax=Terriglobus saanensis (strain ATCC BAA-1853 / DSM 23119 / SP1PR4) TaxID=401053 RepID=E8V4S4_TERSS|nr:Hpt domain-containing protein [Terriglobus saanensis]ADV81478.1 Hpt domain protein [Terriglobus saanensis SP1PR4]
MTRNLIQTEKEKLAAQKIAAIWKENRSSFRERLDLLDRAAEELTETRTLDPDLRSEVTSISHKLAGSLGMFGYLEATAIARRIELDLENPGLPQPERLRKDVDALKSSLATALED